MIKWKVTRTQTFELARDHLCCLSDARHGPSASELPDNAQVCFWGPQNVLLSVNRLEVVTAFGSGPYFGKRKGVGYMDEICRHLLSEPGRGPWCMLFRSTTVQLFKALGHQNFIAFWVQLQFNNRSLKDEQIVFSSSLATAVWRGLNTRVLTCFLFGLCLGKVWI